MDGYQPYEIDLGNLKYQNSICVFKIQCLRTIGLFWAIPEYLRRLFVDSDLHGNILAGNWRCMCFVPALMRIKPVEIDQLNREQVWITTCHGHKGSSRRDKLGIQVTL